jgi:signal transduction histidine kinase
MPLRLAAADYGELCRAIAEEFHAGEQAQRIDIACSGDTAGQCDSGMVSQILSNLLGNALLHGESGQRVQVAVDGSAGPHIALRVANRGVIAAPQLGCLFEPYQQGCDSRKSGQGLGLYTARMFARAHGGDIAVQSDSEQGTVFTVTMPRSPQPSPPTQEPQSA